jgi:type I restriction enzyme S subunit
MSNLPSNWQVKSLGDVVKISKGKKLNSLVDKETSISKRFIQIDDLRNSDYLKYTEDESGLLVNKKDVLIAWDGANAGTVGFGLDGYIGSTIARLEILAENISTNYFGWFLRTKSKYLRDNCTGATIPHVNKSVLGAIKIPLPPLPIQKQIAEILEKADQAKQKRKEANKLTDELLQSVFIEMFGDPVKNPNGIPLKPLEKVCIKITDGTHNSPKNDEYGVHKYITAKNIKKNGIDLRNITYISESDHKAIYSRCNPEFEDILYIKDGVTTGIAQVNTLKEEFSMLSNLALFKLNKSILNPYYLRAYLNNEFVYQNIRNSMGGAAITRLTVDKLKRLPVLVPSLPTQQQFAEIVNKTESLKEKQKQSEQELENLFQSLMQRAFKGELVS